MGFLKDIVADAKLRPSLNQGSDDGDGITYNKIYSPAEISNQPGSMLGSIADADLSAPHDENNASVSANEMSPTGNNSKIVQQPTRFTPHPIPQHSEHTTGIQSIKKMNSENTDVAVTNTQSQIEANHLDAKVSKHDSLEEELSEPRQLDTFGTPSVDDVLHDAGLRQELQYSDTQQQSTIHPAMDLKQNPVHSTEHDDAEVNALNSIRQVNELPPQAAVSLTNVESEDKDTVGTDVLPPKKTNTNGDSDLNLPLNLSRTRTEDASTLSPCLSRQSTAGKDIPNTPSVADAEATHTVIQDANTLTTKDGSNLSNKISNHIFEETTGTLQTDEVSVAPQSEIHANKINTPHTRTDNAPTLSTQVYRSPLADLETTRGEIDAAKSAVQVMGTEKSNNVSNTARTYPDSVLQRNTLAPMAPIEPGLSGLKQAKQAKQIKADAAKPQNRPVSKPVEKTASASQQASVLPSSKVGGGHEGIKQAQQFLVGHGLRIPSADKGTEKSNNVSNTARTYPDSVLQRNTLAPMAPIEPGLSGLKQAKQAKQIKADAAKPQNRPVSKPVEKTASASQQASVLPSSKVGGGHEGIKQAQQFLVGHGLRIPSADKTSPGPALAKPTPSRFEPPKLEIGQIDIVVEEAEVKDTPSRSVNTASQDFASCHYLRRL